jgi:adenylylsulfate kinase
MTPKIVTTAIRMLEISKIRTDGGTQSRLSLDLAVVQEYSELMEVGVEFPPVRTWFDGSEYWLVDGFHRVAAAMRIGGLKLSAEVHSGSLDDARWDSFSANSTHGIRRTAADIEAVIRQALGHPNSRHLSNNQIAQHLHVPEATFRRWRKRLSPSADEDTMRIAVRQGKSYLMQTSKIGTHQPVSAGKQISQELDHARAAATPDARRILNIVEKWIRHHSDTFTFLAALEGLVGSFARSDRTHTNKGLTVWFTGLSSAGKSTLAEAVYNQLRGLRYKVEWLDGDDVRQHFSKGLGFSKEDRDENVRRMGFIAERLSRNGVITLVSAISPYRSTREEIREQVGAFCEVFVNAPLEVCEQRDLKGIYRQARLGAMRSITGIDDPYEPPVHPEVECRTDLESSAQSASRVLTDILNRLAAQRSELATCCNAPTRVSGLSAKRSR